MHDRRVIKSVLLPAADWLRGPLQPLLRRQIESGHAFEEGWFDRAAARRLMDEHVGGGRDRSAVLWPLTAFGLWLDAFRGDGEP